MYKLFFALLLLLTPVVSLAHHAFATDYDADKIGAIEGEVVEVFYKNPHARYYVEVTSDNGQKETWDVQTMNLTMLGRIGWKKDTVKIGDKVMVEGNLGRNNTKRINVLVLEKEDGTVLKPMETPGAKDKLKMRSKDDQTSLAAAVEVGTYELDDTHAYLNFSYSHLGLSFPKLRFTEFDALLNLDGKNIENSQVEVTIDAASIDTSMDDFDEKLAGEEFLDAENFPEIVFKSSSYKEISASKGQLTGDLTVKGTTRPAVLDVTINQASQNLMSAKDTIGFSATGKVLRSDFGLDAYAPSVGDELSLNIQAEFVKTN